MRNINRVFAAGILTITTLAGAGALDRPGDLGGSDPWKDAESCLHSGSTPMSCANAQ